MTRMSEQWPPVSGRRGSRYPALSLLMMTDQEMWLWEYNGTVGDSWLMESQTHPVTEESHLYTNCLAKTQDRYTIETRFGEEVVKQEGNCLTSCSSLPEELDRTDLKRRRNDV